MIIDSATVGTYRIPIRKPWGDQTHRITDIDLVVVDLLTDVGLTGTGFSYTVGVGVKAIEALLLWDIVPKLIGQTVAPRPIFHQLWTRLHDAGAGGVTTMALAAVDIAAWDLVGKEQDRALVDVLGRSRDRIAAYGSGVNLNLPVEALLEQVDGWLSSGYDAVKIKVGKADLAEDVERVAAVREFLGPTRRLMIDANQGWDVPAATRAIKALARFDLHWVEEPIISDDIRGHRSLVDATAVPIAIGENVYSIYQFSQYLQLGAVSYVQADVVRVGGITPWLEIASLASSYGIPMAPHFMLEISGQLLCCVSNAHILEDVAGGSFGDLGILATDVGASGGFFEPPTKPGHGIEFDRQVLERYQAFDHSLADAEGLARAR